MKAYKHTRTCIHTYIHACMNIYINTYIRAFIHNTSVCGIIDYLYVNQCIYTDPNVKPKDIPIPESDPTTRSSDSISLTWKPIKQLLTKLVLQCQLYNAKKVPFETFDLTKSGNKQVRVIS